VKALLTTRIQSGGKRNFTEFIQGYGFIADVFGLIFSQNTGPAEIQF
jgi:hypothetical protein